jgi:hypothetical protein
VIKAPSYEFGLPLWTARDRLALAGGTTQRSTATLVMTIQKCFRPPYVRLSPDVRGAVHGGRPYVVICAIAADRVCRNATVIGEPVARTGNGWPPLGFLSGHDVRAVAGGPSRRCESKRVHRLTLQLDEVRGMSRPCPRDPQSGFRGYASGPGSTNRRRPL